METKFVIAVENLKVIVSFNMKMTSKTNLFYKIMKNTYIDAE